MCSACTIQLCHVVLLVRIYVCGVHSVIYPILVSVYIVTKVEYHDMVYTFKQCYIFTHP